MSIPRFRLYAFRRDWPAEESILEVVEKVTAEVFGAAGEVEVVYLDDGNNADLVLAAPMLVRLAPPPKRYFVGDLTNVERLRCLLGNNDLKNCASARTAADGIQPTIG